MEKLSNLGKSKFYWNSKKSNFIEYVYFKFKKSKNKAFPIFLFSTGKRVNVNLYRSNREYALQVSIRYGEGAIVRNAMTNNVWGTEEREGGLPINKGEMYASLNRLFVYILFKTIIRIN